jgi:hypothetical protein
MSNNSRRTFGRLRLGGLAVALALLVTLAVGSPAFSGPNTKTFSAVFTATAPGGANFYGMSLTLENLGSPQLGSADVAVPTGFVIQNVTGAPVGSTFTSSSIQLRNLNLASGAPVQFSITAHVPCRADRSYNWSITGRQNNDGGGATFALAPSPPSSLGTVVGQNCTLSIPVDRQPNHAEVDTPITTTAYNDPLGQSVKVLARNGDNAVPLASDGGTVTLGRTAGLFTSGPSGPGFSGNALSLSGGEVSFPDLESNRTGFSLRLTATSPGYNSSVASNSFDIQVDGCKGASCTPSTPSVGGGTHTQASVTGTVLQGGDSLGVGLIKYQDSEFTFPPGFCSTGAFVPLADSDGFTTSVQVVGGTPGQRDYTVTAILDKFIMNQVPQNGADAILTCLFGNRIDPVSGLPRTCSEDILAGLTGFPTVNDPNNNGSFRARCDVGGTESWGGILPKAGPGINSCTDAALTDPVVLSQNKSGGPPGSLVIKICKPWPATVTATQLPWDGGGGWR